MKELLKEKDFYNRCRKMSLTNSGKDLNSFLKLCGFEHVNRFSNLPS